MPEVNQSHFYKYDIRHTDVMSSINVCQSSTQQVWMESLPSVTGLFLSLPPSLSGSRGERSVQGGGELVFGLGGPWTQILSLFHSCHSGPSPPCPLPPAPVRGRPHLKGVPCYPASLMKSDTRPEDLIQSATGPLPPLFCLLLLTAVAHTEFAVMRVVYTREASVPHQGGGGSKGRCNCMDSSGPNCLYS